MSDMAAREAEEAGDPTTDAFAIGSDGMLPRAMTLVTVP